MRELLKFKSAICLTLMTMISIAAWATPVKIYVKADAAPNLYVWTTVDGNEVHPNGDWPGDPLTSTVAINGETWYVYDNTYDNVQAIINNGEGQQTGDITITKDNNAFVYDGGDKFYPVSYRDEKTFVYAEDGNNWDRMFVYLWNAEDDINSGWNAHEMETVGTTADGKKIFRWSSNDLSFIPTNVIFHNNQEQNYNQTADLDFNNGNFYHVSNTVNGENKRTATVDNVMPILPLDEAHFPDENFRALLSKNGNILTKSGLNSITVLDYYPDLRNGETLEGDELIASKVKTLEGVKYLYNLTYFSLRGGSLETADLTYNVKLKNLDVSDNKLTELPLNGLTDLIRLDCQYNQLTSLDVSNLSQLENLTCGNNKISQLDLSSNKKLESIDVEHNNLTALNLDSEPNQILERLSCSFNELSNINVENFSHLSYLFVSGNSEMSHLSLPVVDGETPIVYLACSNCNLSEIDLQNCTNLEMLLIDGNPLTSLDLSATTQLMYLNVYNTNIVNLDLTNNHKLSYVKMPNPHAPNLGNDWNETYVQIGNAGWKSDDDLEFGVISPNGRDIKARYGYFGGNGYKYYIDCSRHFDWSFTQDGFNVDKIKSVVGGTLIDNTFVATDDSPEYLKDINTSMLYPNNKYIIIDPANTTGKLSLFIETGFESNATTDELPARRNYTKSNKVSLKDSDSDDFIEITDSEQLNQLFGTAEIVLNWTADEPPTDFPVLNFSVPSGSTLRYGREVLVDVPDWNESMERGRWSGHYLAYYTTDGTEPSIENGRKVHNGWYDGIEINEETAEKTIRIRGYKEDYQENVDVSSESEAIYHLMPQVPYKFKKISSADDLEADAHYLIMAVDESEGGHNYIAVASFDWTNTREQVTVLGNCYDDEIQSVNGEYSISQYYYEEPYLLSGNASDGWKFTSTEGLQITPRERSQEALEDDEYKDPEGEMDLTLVENGNGATARITFDENGYASIVFDGFDGRVAFQNNDDDGFVYRPAGNDKGINIELWKEVIEKSTVNSNFVDGSELHYGQPVFLTYANRADDDLLYYTTDGTEPTVGGATTRFCYSADFLFATTTGKYKILFTDKDNKAKTDVATFNYSIKDDQQHVYAQLVTDESQLVAGDKYFIVTTGWDKDDEVEVIDNAMTPFANPYKLDVKSMGRKGMFEIPESYEEFSYNIDKSPNDVDIDAMEGVGSYSGVEFIEFHDMYDIVNHYFPEAFTLGGEKDAWTFTSSLGTSLYADGSSSVVGDLPVYSIEPGATPTVAKINIENDEAKITFNDKVLIDEEHVGYTLVDPSNYYNNRRRLRLYRVIEKRPYKITYVESENGWIGGDNYAFAGDIAYVGVVPVADYNASLIKITRDDNNNVVVEGDQSMENYHWGPYFPMPESDVTVTVQFTPYPEISLEEYFDAKPGLGYIINEDLTVMLVREDVGKGEYDEDDDAIEEYGYGVMYLRDNKKAINPFYAEAGDDQVPYRIIGTTFDFSNVDERDNVNYTQNNWLQVICRAIKTDGNKEEYQQTPMNFNEGDIIKAGTLKGLNFGEKEMKLSRMLIPLYDNNTENEIVGKLFDFKYPEVKEGEKGNTDKNVYSPANFMGAYLNWNNDAPAVGASGPTAENYFFMTPKQNEIANLTWLVYKEVEITDEDGSVETVPAFFMPQPTDETTDEGKTIYHNNANLNGGIVIDWTTNMCQGDIIINGSTRTITADTQPGDIFEPDEAYQITAAITCFNPENTEDYNIDGGSEPMARRLKEIHAKTNIISDTYVITPVMVEKEKNPATSIDNIVNDVVKKEVKAVRYYNVAGIECGGLSSGVNIVVTEYTDGTTTTAKILR